MKVQLWLTYFSLNSTGATAPRDIPWVLGGDLPADEAWFIVPSIQEFQIGENSDGTHLRAAAVAWAGRHGHDDFVRVIDLFIAEEQRHAAELGRFLSINGFPVLSRSAGDSAFRILRHLTGGLEASMLVLLTAEIIGYVYYGALRAGTRSALLRAVCDTFLRDEAAHLLFHTDLVSSMRRKRPRLIVWMKLALSRLLMAGACGVVWWRHRLVLQRGGLTLASFARRCFERLDFIARIPHDAPHQADRRQQPARTPS